MLQCRPSWVTVHAQFNQMTFMATKCHFLDAIIIWKVPFVRSPKASSGSHFHIPLSFVLYFPSHAASDTFFSLFGTFFYVRNLKKMRSVESLYHKESNMFRPLSKVKSCSAGIVLGWVTKYEYPVLGKNFSFFPYFFQGNIKEYRAAILM